MEGGWRFQISNQVRPGGRGPRLLPVLSHHSGTCPAADLAADLRANVSGPYLSPAATGLPRPVRQSVLPKWTVPKEGPSLARVLRQHRREAANFSEVRRVIRQAVRKAEIGRASLSRRVTICSPTPWTFWEERTGKYERILTSAARLLHRLDADPNLTESNEPRCAIC